MRVQRRPIGTSELNRSQRVRDGPRSEEENLRFPRRRCAWSRREQSAGRRKEVQERWGLGVPPCSSHDRPAREDNTNTRRPPSGSRSPVARACAPPASPPLPAPQSAMKLTCLAAAGRGGGYHSPASYLLELEGLRFLLDCPVDLSVLAAFAPVPLGVHNGDVGDLISAVPYYWSPAAAAAAKTGGVDAVLVSSATGMLGLPFLTRLPCFANTKVYVTELAARIGKLMMRELVEMHSEFVRYYGPDIDGPPKWMEGEKLDKLMSVLQKVVNEDEVKDLAPFMPLYSATSIDECMQKTQPVKYSEEVCFNGMLMLKASSSGLELGNCVWSIKGPRASITCLSSTVFVSAHALDFDYNSLKENDIILFSDFSSLNAMDEDNENLNVNGTDENGTLLCDDSVLRENGVNEDKNFQCLSINDDIADEIERIGFICSCIMDAIKSGGSVLIPIGRLGVILLILEYISETLHFSNMKVPIFMISGAAEKTIAFTNAVPEWLCKPRQEKLFSGEALFGHVELLKEGRLFLFPHLYSKGLLMEGALHCILSTLEP